LNRQGAEDAKRGSQEIPFSTGVIGALAVQLLAFSLRVSTCEKSRVPASKQQKRSDGAGAEAQ
jgi:hypothetical protein